MSLPHIMSFSMIEAGKTQFEVGTINQQELRYRFRAAVAL